jgi:3-hydroxyisobutyrate dehydrogenase-like beta-hydroxyacid dehydrogenase
MKIGFIGLGQMGTGMAANLVRAGHDVAVWNRSPGKSESLVKSGAREAKHVAQACDAEVVITMLANDEALREVALTPSGIVASLPKGATHVSMSTVGVDLVRELTQAHAHAGQHFVSAPVFGRPDRAADAQLFIVAAGESSALGAVKPLFDVMGQRTFELGADPAAASLVKLCGNFMLAAAIETLGEAMALVGKAGVDPRVFVDVMTSTLFTARAYTLYGGLIAEGKFEPAGFAAPLGLKDVGLVLEASNALRVPMPLAHLLTDRFLRLLAQGGEQLDWSAIAKLAAEDAGLKT